MNTTPTSVRRHFSRTGLVAPFIIFAVVAVILLGVAAYYYLSLGGDADIIDPIMAKVTHGEFVSQVLDQGEVQSSENVEIRCEVRARSGSGSMTVISVTPEATSVKPGDFLVQLDSTLLEKELEQQNLAMANAETNVIQAETGLATAIATKDEYIQGLFVEKKLEIENDIHVAESAITKAEQELTQASAVLKHSKKLMAKGFITNQALESDEFAVELARIALLKGGNAKKLELTRLEVLEEITFKKEENILKADIKAANVRLRSENTAFKVEEEKLAEIEEMIDKCTIRVPEGVQGQVVFAKESSRGREDWILEEGTSVRENQVLVRLPNPDKMEVKALINEQSITQIEPNMPATINVDALNNQTLKGFVTKVNQYADSSGWGRSSIRKYAVYVRIIDPPSALKPGMNASVSIQVQYQPDVLLAPIQTIYAVQDKQFCLVRNGDNDWETIEVEIAGDNSQMVYIKSGVEEGTELVMNPGAYKEFMDLPEIERDSKIVLPEGAVAEIGTTSGESGGNPGSGQAGERQGGGGGRQGGGGGGGFEMPANGAALISSKDTDGDGKLTSEEAGVPFTYFFADIDTDGDGFLSQTEADASVKMMQERRRNREQGGGGQRGGGGGGGQRGGGE